MSEQQRRVWSVVLVNLEGSFCEHDNRLIPEASRGEPSSCKHVNTRVWLSPRSILWILTWPPEWKSGIQNLKAALTSFDSLREITPNKSTELMQEIWLPTVNGQLLVLSKVDESEEQLGCKGLASCLF